MSILMVWKVFGFKENTKLLDDEAKKEAKTFTATSKYSSFNR